MGVTGVGGGCCSTGSAWREEYPVQQFPEHQVGGWLQWDDDGGRGGSRAQFSTAKRVLLDASAQAAIGVQQQGGRQAPSLLPSARHPLAAFC
jgi:hypothetical protein